MRAWFHAVTAVDAGIARPFALGGGVAAGPDEPTENFFAWDERSGLLISAAGMGNADGHLEMYLDAAAPARAFVDAALACAPSLALVDVVHEAARAMAAVAASVYRARYAGTAVEIAVMRFRPDGRIDLAQQGGQALFRRRAGRTERVIRLGTIGDEHGPQANPEYAQVPIRVLCSDGRRVGDLATVSLDWQPGDRFLLTTRGVHPYVDEATIDACLALDPDEIVPALLTAVRRTERRRKQPSAAALVIE